jgi:hypothetical protein
VKQITPPNQRSYPGPGVEEVIDMQRILTTGPPISSGRTANLVAGSKTWLEHVADDYQRCNGRFVPLVRKNNGFTCSLDILFLRRDGPYSLVANGGDIDNRLKVLLDGLRMPQQDSELGSYSIDADENPFFCLLEDDSLITSIQVTTDRLISPLLDKDHVHDVHLIIHATVVNPSALFAGNLLI